jgi:hypothetical protein
VCLQAEFLQERGDSYGVTEPYARSFYRQAIPTGLAVEALVPHHQGECD